MASSKSNNALQRHTAAPQLAGYLYQIQCSLIELFDLQEGEVLGIEVIDDLSITSKEEIRVVEQYKYHIPSKQVKLRDTSKELWNTLGTWASAITDKSLDLSNVRNFILFTRALPDPGSAIEQMASDQDRDINALVTRLLAIPKSTDKKLAKAFEDVHSLSRADLSCLIEKMIIKANQPNIIETINNLHGKIRKLGFHAHSIDNATYQFCGWLWDKVIRGLESDIGIQIEEAEFHAAKCHIRDNFIHGKLYPRYANMNISEIDTIQQRERLYIRQLDIIGAREEIKLSSILDYFKASTERSKWIETGEMLPDDLELYDRELYQKWENLHEGMKDDLIGEMLDDDLLKRAGMKHFRLIQDVRVPIRVEWIYSYLTRGSYHALADDLQVGWHPCFRELLK